MCIGGGNSLEGPQRLSTHDLHLDELSRRFGRRWAVARVSVDIPAGSGFAITGGNGSGKTTLLRCLSTALHPHYGHATLGGLDMWQQRDLVRPQVALLSHATRLYDDLSGAENLDVWARLGGFEVDVAAAMARVGLDWSRPEPVRAYSAGMRRRLALARALLKNPKLVLLDEPFASLDPEGREMVRSVIRDLRDVGTTVIVATHLPASAQQVCDRAIRLEAGQIVWRGPTAEAAVAA